MEFTVVAAGFELHCDVSWAGDDCLVSLQGGDAPHIGSVAMAISRMSLTGMGNSATTSTLNRVGHKDDFLANPIAHEVAARLGCVVVCVAGVHVDSATPAQISAIQDSVPQIVEKVCALAPGAPRSAAVRVAGPGAGWAREVGV